MDSNARKEIEDERHALAKMLAASNISNADFHAALEQFDREHECELEREQTE